MGVCKVFENIRSFKLIGRPFQIDNIITLIVYQKFKLTFFFSFEKRLIISTARRGLGRGGSAPKMEKNTVVGFMYHVTVCGFPLSIQKTGKNLFVRNFKDMSEDIFAEVFCPKFYLLKIFVLNLLAGT